MRIVDDGSPASTYWSFVLGHDNLSPVEQQRHWLEDTTWSWSDKDGSIVSISRISEVIMSKSSSLMLWNLHLYNNSFEWKNVTFSGGQNILWPLLHFSGPLTPGSTSVICSGLGSLECFVIIKCTKFGQLILRKIIKIVATRYQILGLKCTKFDFGWGSAPDRAPPQTPLGELTALPQTP